MKKKYQEISLSRFILGEDCVIYDAAETDSSIEFYAKTYDLEYECPHCSSRQSRPCSTYQRTLQHIPLRPGKKTIVHLTAYRYRCPQCQHVFDQPLSFVRRYQVRTDLLNEFILLFSLFNSYECTSRLLGEMGIEVCADTIQNMTERIQFESYQDVEEIAIDDIAIRKGMTYVTMIYDSKKKELICILDGRDFGLLAGFLKAHPEIRIVERDRDSAYAKAIRIVNPECIQIADRFHLYQNLIEALRTWFYSIVDKDFWLIHGILHEQPEYDYIPIRYSQMSLDALDYDLSLPVDEDQKEIVFDKSYKTRNSSYQLKKKKESLERAARKKERIIAVRKFCLDHSLEQTADNFGISMATVRTYTSLLEEQIDEYVRPKPRSHPSKYEKYAGLIYKMLTDHIPGPMIVQYILYRFDPECNPDSLQTYIYSIARNNNLSGVHVSRRDYVERVVTAESMKLRRCDLLHQLCVKNERKKIPCIQESLLEIMENYPEVKKIQEAFQDFDSVIFGGDPDDLDQFLEKYKESPLSGFCSGLSKDVIAVKNAILYRENSGLAEGLNGKAKCLKRIVYGKIRLVNFEIRMKLITHSNKEKSFIDWVKDHFIPGKELF